MYFSNRTTTINKMATGNQNLYLFKAQRFNLAGNFAQRGNKRHRVVVIP